MEEENNQVTEEKNELTPLEELSEKLTQSEDKYVRLYAEFDNYKRRTMKDKEELVVNTKVKMLSSILDMDNDLSIAIKSVKSEALA